jgi:hypothetical protein
MLKLHEFPKFIEGHDKLRLVNNRNTSSLSYRMTQARQAHMNVIQEMGTLDLLSTNKRSYSILPFHTDEVSFSFP